MRLRAPKACCIPSWPLVPWQIVTLDLVGKFTPAADSGHNSCLVIVDKFSKYTMLEGCSDAIGARETATIFIKRVVSVWGVPAIVISDRGPPVQL